MKAYLSLIEINLKLAVREKIVLFFTFLFPLIFFFIFGQMLDAGRGGVGVRVVSMVLVLGVLGNGLFGAGVRAVVERENNILRRYKVAPISPAPMLVASIVTGWLLYLPVIVLVIGLAHLLWAVPIPRHWISLLVLLSAGAWAMRAIGLIVASVANTTAEGNIIVQLLYMPMLFLSGAAFPISALPEWAQIVSQFLPATYLHNGMERVMVRGESLADNLAPVLALLLSTLVGAFISVKIFRWEKEEVLPAKAKLWLLVVGLPFIVMGLHQAYSRDNIEEAKALDRQIRRNRTRLVRNARIFVGDGRLIESGALLIRNGRIAEVYDGPAPEPDSLNAEAVEAAGKTVLPGLIDLNVRLSAPGGVPAGLETVNSARWMERAAAAYLYCGVTAVRSTGDPLETILELGRRIDRGERPGAEIFAPGPRPDPSSNAVFLVPSLSWAEAAGQLAAGRPDLLSRSLVEQIAPKGMIEATRAAVSRGQWSAAGDGQGLATATDNLLRAYRQGRPLAAGTGSGNPLLIHGPALHRELQLWVEAGIPPAAALQAVTYNAARLLGAAGRIGVVRQGCEATLLVVDGNPLEEISATERISLVFFKGERVNRTALLDTRD